MGKLVQGILGGVSGKVGTVIGSIRNGKAYIRGLNTSNKDPKTKRQLAQRMKFKLGLQLVAPASDFIKIGFRNYAVGHYAVNSAMAYNLKAAITGNYPSFGIDPSKVVLSRGKLTEAEGASASVSGNMATFTWDDNSSEEDADMSDFALLAVYNFTKRKVAESLEVASRMDGKATVKIPNSWSKDKLSFYIAFASVESEAVSESVYIGDIVGSGTAAEGANGIIKYETASDDNNGNQSGSGSSTTTPSTPSGDKGSGSTGSGSESGSGSGSGSGSDSDDNNSVGIE